MEEEQMSEAKPSEFAFDFDAVVLGAGFSGLYMLHRLRNEMGLSVRVLEAGGGVGGTWYWNRYPGARSDSESFIYCYSFDEKLWQEWEWSERYPEQEEVRAYLEHVAERYDLKRDIRFNSRVTSATFDETDAAWVVRTEDGATVTARFLITGVGCLSAWYTPPFPGLDDFRGASYYTGLWPHHEVDFSGQRVAVIGTGASGVQCIPLIAKQAAELTVFQRTPNYIVPANHGPVPAEVTAERKQNFHGIWEHARNSAFGMPYDFEKKPLAEHSDAELDELLTQRWERGGLSFLLSTFIEPLVDLEANRRVASWLDQRIKEKVHDPATADLLTPKKLTYAVKRIPLDSGYYETFNSPHVHLVDVSSNAIAAITPDGLRLTDGSEYAFDSIVFATGFDATTGTLNRIDIRGRGGQLLRDKWADGPRTYLGMSSADFPNLLMITGPQSPGVLSNMPVSIEQHVQFISRIIEEVRNRGAVAVEPTADAEAGWVAHNEEVAAHTLFPLADTTYTGANIVGKARAFLPNIDTVAGYRQLCEQAIAKDFEGFVFADAAG
jgi:cation diffusion facilitator CzcD-associated flavoprotein CzcO